MEGLCRYKDFFGAPGTGSHKYRIFGFAALDLAMTVVFALFVSWLFGANFIATLTITMIGGIAIHKLFCVETALNKRLGF